MLNMKTTNNPNINQIDELYPMNSVENMRARAIIRPLIKKFNESPSDFLAQELEQYGFVVDHSDGDYGTGARGERIN